jgi:hypothetical protein
MHHLKLRSIDRNQVGFWATPNFDRSKTMEGAYRRTGLKVFLFVPVAGLGPRAPKRNPIWFARMVVRRDLAEFAETRTLLLDHPYLIA